MNNKISYIKAITSSLFRFNYVIDLLKMKWHKVLIYFIFLNLLMFLPISYQIIDTFYFANEVDYEEYGIDFVSNPPEWWTDELPNTCKIKDSELTCIIDYVYEYEYTTQNNTYTIILNAEDPTLYNNDNTLVFHQYGFDYYFSDQDLSNYSGNVLRFTYKNFNTIYFDELKLLEDGESAELFINNLFNSIKSVSISPIILGVLVALFIPNIILVFVLSGLSMLFSLNDSGFIKYREMIKLYVFGSTWPSIIATVLAMLGMATFTPLVYNFLTPIIVFVMYRKSKQQQLIDGTSFK